MEDLRVEYVPIGSLKPYEKNAKEHPDWQIDEIKKSIEMAGMVDPIGVWKDGTIIEGHGRYLACKELGMDTVPIIRLSHLTDEQRRAYALVHNKTTMDSGFDKDFLEEELNNIFNIDMTDFGFDLEEEKEQVAKVKPEVEFSEVLGEENNYLILQFKTDIDWLQALSVFDIKQVKCYSTRNDGKITSKMQRIGVGRVLDGAEALRKLVGDV